MKKEEFNTKQKRAFNYLIKGKNIFLTGPGGTGKSYVIQKFITWCNNNQKNCIVCAPTGIAAVNIGGITMHNAFAIPVPAFGKNVESVSLSKVKALQMADVVIIDEISMCRCDVFDYAYKMIERIEKFVGKKIQIVVVGDFFQLPPVVTKDDEKKLKQFGYDPSGFCFTTKSWEKCKFQVIELTESMRQNNQEFVDKLNAIRKGERNCLSYFTARITNEFPENCIYLCPTNAKADSFNQEKMNQLSSPTYAYQSTHTGRLPKDLPAEQTLLLKKGCRVLFTVNDNIHGDYYNGNMGTVTKCYKNHVLVQIDDGKEVDVYPHTWDIYNYKIEHGLLEKDIVATFSQIPLKLAYAITIHKSQGQTYSKAIIHPAAFADGQFYVVVSRLKSIDGLYFDDEILPMYIKVNEKVLKFCKEYTYKVPASQVKKQKTIDQKQKKALQKKKNTTRTKKKNQPIQKTIKNAVKSISKSMKTKK